MSYVRYIWRVWRLKKATRKLETARHHSITKKPSFRDHLNKFIDGFIPLWWKRYLRRRRSESAVYDRRRRTPIVQLILKSLLLFTTGLLLAIACHLFAVYYLFLDRETSTWVCICIATVMSVGLTFSQRVRCITFLAAPQIFTGKGRTMLLAYVLIAANNAILSNTVKNVESFINSTICLQNKVADLLPPPIAKELKVQYINGSGDASEQRKKSFKDTWARLKRVFKSMDTLYNQTWMEIRHKYSWLKDKQTFCKKTKAILILYADEVITRLYEHWVVLSLAHWLPHILRSSAKKIIDEGFEAICDLDEDGYELFSLQKILGLRLSTIKRYLKEQLQLNVTFEHRFVYDLTSSKSVEEIKRAVWEDVKRSFDIPLKLINLTNMLLNGFMLLIFIKSYVYYQRFSRSVHYDNYYISKEMRLLDSRRGFLGLPTILPLNWKERLHYVSTSSLILVGKERKKLAISFFLTVASALHVSYYMLLDYTLHWVAVYFRTFEGLVIRIEEPVLPKLDIKGEGIASVFVRGTKEAFDPFFNYAIPPVDLTPCIPKTSEPDYDSYVRIAGLLFAAVLLALLGAWGLRLRHLIAAHYNPDMESARAIWLHRKISSRRALKRLLKSRKRKRYVFRHPSQIFRVILEYLTTSFPLLHKLLERFGYSRQFCSNCGEGSDVDDSGFKDCQNSGCTAVYCPYCFKMLNNECHVCGRPIDYLSSGMVDISEERDSSDEDFYSF